ncbi:DUF4292 domain-containing protein [Bacteroidota bacterium]
MGKHIEIIIIGVMVLLFAACRPQKQISIDEKPETDNAELSIISMLEQKTHKFRTAKFRKVEINFLMNGVREKVRGNIAIYRDSMMAISIIPALGYEMLRILCTKDSVIIINRPDKSYSATSFDYYRRKYDIPVEFADLQAILANEVFYYKDNYGDRIYERQLNTRNENTLYMVDAFRDGQRITNQGIEIDKGGRKLENVFITDYDRKMRMNIDYEDFNGNENIIFPQKLTMDLIENNNSIKMEIYYGQVVFDDSIAVEFSAPTQYTRSDI